MATTKDLITAKDAMRYIQGIVNDFEYSLVGKEETIAKITELMIKTAIAVEKKCLLKDVVIEEDEV